MWTFRVALAALPNGLGTGVIREALAPSTPRCGLAYGRFAFQAWLPDWMIDAMRATLPGLLCPPARILLESSTRDGAVDAVSSSWFGCCAHRLRQLRWGRVRP